jgi:hypothetical protein
MAILLLDLYFDKWVADFEDRTKVFGIVSLLRAVGAKVAELVTDRLGNRNRRRRAIVAQTIRDRIS